MGAAEFAVAVIASSVQSWPVTHWAGCSSGACKTLHKEI
jgi:hypothetical protein